MKLFLAFIMLMWSSVSYARDVSIYTDWPSGSGPDIMARAFGNYIKNNMPGIDNIVIYNKPGGSGAGIKYYFENSKKDELQLGLFPFIPYFVYLDKTIDEKYMKTSEVFWSKSATFGSFVTIRPTADVINVGIMRALGGPNIIDRIGYDILGIKYKAIPGYPTPEDIYRAVKSGEIDTTRGDPYEDVFVENMIKTNSVRMLWHTEYNDDEYALSNVYKKKFGKAPEGPLWDAYLALNDMVSISFMLIRYTGYEQDVDPQTTTELNRVIKKMSQDPDFISTPLGRKIFSQHHKIGKDANQKVKNFSVSPEVQQFLSRYND